MPSTSESVNAVVHFSTTRNASSLGPAVAADESDAIKTTADRNARIFPRLTNVRRIHSGSSRTNYTGCRCARKGRGISSWHIRNLGGLRGWDERRQAVDRAGQTRDLLARHGIDCPTITGAGAGTFEFEGGEWGL